MRIEDVQVGEQIGFKGDHEQRGTVVAIETYHDGWTGRRQRKLLVQVGYEYHDHDIWAFRHPEHGLVVEVYGDTAIWRAG